MELHFENLEDRILWHVIRELSSARDGVSIPHLVQTLSDLGPSAVSSVIEKLQREEIVTGVERERHDGCG